MTGRRGLFAFVFVADPSLASPEYAGVKAAYLRATKGKGLGYAQVG